jgi:hypothetical protein
MEAGSAIEADISRLDSGIRQLKIQYDMFFAGAAQREPFELRQQVERLIKKYANAEIKKYHHRFQFTALVARYNCLCELWGRTLRTLEDGGRAVPAERGESREQVVARCRLADLSQDEHELRRIHEGFCEARERVGAGSAPISFDKFSRRIAAQARKIREDSGCDVVELRVVVSGGQVQLKARPGR